MDTAVGESKHRKWHRLMTADTAACSPLPVEQTLKKKRSYEAMSVMVTAENSEHGKYEDLIPFTHRGSAAAVQSVHVYLWLVLDWHCHCCSASVL